jgi:hypothetical protein
VLEQRHLTLEHHVRLLPKVALQKQWRTTAHALVRGAPAQRRHVLLAHAVQQAWHVREVAREEGELRVRAVVRPA